MEPRPAKVLIVDDEPQVCSLIRKELTFQGHICQVATGSQEAIDLLNSHKFDLLLVDICMPEISGLDLLAHTKRRIPGCKVILLTGQSNREHIAQALILGAYDYIEKPFDMDELVASVCKAVSPDNDMPQLPVRAAAAMEITSRTRQASLDSVRALARAVEAKDIYTRRHSEQVTYYVVSLAKFMNLSEATVESLRIASLLHDIGKIGVPDRILTKSGKLTREEFDCMCRHPAIGADILANITLFGQEAQLVRHHHERWDGQGYPDGLAGEEIPQGARIIAIADSMDAMLMDRSYKNPYSVERMLQELVRCSGMQFDPQIAATAWKWCQRNMEKLILAERRVSHAAT